MHLFGRTNIIPRPCLIGLHSKRMSDQQGYSMSTLQHILTSASFLWAGLKLHQFTAAISSWGRLLDINHLSQTCAFNLLSCIVFTVRILVTHCFLSTLDTCLWHQDLSSLQTLCSTLCRRKRRTIPQGSTWRSCTTGISCSPKVLINVPCLIVLLKWMAAMTVQLTYAAEKVCPKDEEVNQSVLDYQCSSFLFVCSWGLLFLLLFQPMRFQLPWIAFRQLWCVEQPWATACFAWYFRQSSQNTQSSCVSQDKRKKSSSPTFFPSCLFCFAVVILCVFLSLSTTQYFLIFSCMFPNSFLLNDTPDFCHVLSFWLRFSTCRFSTSTASWISSFASLTSSSHAPGPSSFKLESALRGGEAASMFGLLSVVPPQSIRPNHRAPFLSTHFFRWFELHIQKWVFLYVVTLVSVTLLDSKAGDPSPEKRSIWAPTPWGPQPPRTTDTLTASRMSRTTRLQGPIGWGSGVWGEKAFGGR